VAANRGGAALHLISLEDDLRISDCAPVLFMDLGKVEARYQEITSALPGIDIHYAMKCNPFLPILSRLKSLGSKFEIASANELDDLLTISVEPSSVLFSHPVKPISHIASTYAAGVRCFAFDSTEELAKLAMAAPGAGVMVRLASRGVISDVHSEGKFGVDVDTAVTLLSAARERGLRPLGVSFHVGSQMMRPDAWRAPLEEVGQVMDKLSAENTFLELVDIGGGFPAYYDVKPPPLSEYGAVITAGITSLPYPVRAVVEPGRALVAEAGTLMANVIGTATRFGQRWVHLDVGALHGLIESLETNNELRFPIWDSRNSLARLRCILTGPTCDSQDTILFDAELSAGLSVGDRVFIGSAGAYSTVVASSFNGFDPPIVRAA
jgi:ornithine decarboxylase